MTRAVLDAVCTVYRFCTISSHTIVWMEVGRSKISSVIGLVPMLEIGALILAN
jgi:hypothetical protein